MFLPTTTRLPACHPRTAPRARSPDNAVHTPDTTAAAPPGRCFPPSCTPSRCAAWCGLGTPYSTGPLISCTMPRPWRWLRCVESWVSLVPAFFSLDKSVVFLSAACLRFYGIRALMIVFCRSVEYLVVSPSPPAVGLEYFCSRMLMRRQSLQSRSQLHES